MFASKHTHRCHTFQRTTSSAEKKIYETRFSNKPLAYVKMK